MKVFSFVILSLKKRLQDYQNNLLLTTKKVYAAYKSQTNRKISKSSISNWIHKMIHKGMNPISINFYITQIKVFANWLIKNEYCEPFEIKLIKTQEAQIKTLSDEEVEMLLERPSMWGRFSPYRSWVIINFILATGARASTVMNLKVEDIDFDYKEIRFTHLKNKKSAIVPLSSSLERVLKTFLTRHTLVSITMMLNVLILSKTERYLPKVISEMSRMT